MPKLKVLGDMRFVEYIAFDFGLNQFDFNFLVANLWFSEFRHY